MIAVAKVMIVPECFIMNPIRSANFCPHLTVPSTALTIVGFSFSTNSIPISLNLFLACANFAAAVSDLVAACSIATLVPVTA